MDTFIRDKAVQEKGRGQSVVVWGSNAAIDAVAAAKKHGWTLAAWLYSRDGQPAWLPGTRYRSDPYRLQDVNHYVYNDRRRIKIEDSGPLLKVLDGAHTVADNVHYVVYGLGTEDILTQRQGGLMDNSVLEGERMLSPILDTSGASAMPSSRGGRRKPSSAGRTHPGPSRCSGWPPRTTRVPWIGKAVPRGFH